MGLWGAALLAGRCSLGRHGRPGPAAPLRCSRPTARDGAGSRGRGPGPGGGSLGTRTARRPVRMARGWTAGALPSGKDVTLPSPARPPAQPLLKPPGPAARRAGSGAPRYVAWGHERWQRSCVRGSFCLHSGTQHAVPTAEVPVGLILCVLDLCLSLSAEIRVVMCSGAF